MYRLGSHLAEAGTIRLPLCRHVIASMRCLALLGVLGIICCGCQQQAAPPPAETPVAVPPTAPPTPAVTTEPLKSEPASVETNAATSAKPTPPAEESLEALLEPDDEPFAPEAGFTLLTLDDFEAYGAEPETWTAVGQAIACTGKPKGYIYSRQAHQNFTWRLEYRFLRPKSLKEDAKFKGNTGFLVYVTGEHKLWPVCLEVQGKHVQMAAIKENGGAAPVTVEDDDDARRSARHIVGDWNQLEIVAKDGALEVRLNDIPVSRSQPNFLSEGKIGIQAEDHPFAVRRLRIRDE